VRHRARGINTIWHSLFAGDPYLDAHTHFLLGIGDTAAPRLWSRASGAQRSADERCGRGFCLSYTRDRSGGICRPDSALAASQ